MDKNTSHNHFQQTKKPKVNIKYLQFKDKSEKKKKTDLYKQELHQIVT